MSSFLVSTLRAPFRFIFLVAAAVSSPHFGQTGKRGCFDEALPAFDEADRQHIRTSLPRSGEPAWDASCEILPCRRRRAGRGKCSRPLVNGPGLITFVKDKLSVTRSLFIWQEHFLDLTLNQKAGVHSLVKDPWEAK